jgi:hypothetical protein
MRRFLTIFGTVILICSCQIQNSNDVSTVTKDSTITAQEQAQLDALKPQADSIIMEVFGDKDALSPGKQLDLKKLAIFKEKMKVLLKSQFGDGYTKFISETSYPLTTGINSSQKSANIVSGAPSKTIYDYQYPVNLATWSVYYPWTSKSRMTDVEQICYSIDFHITANTDIYGSYTWNYINQWITEWKGILYWCSSSWENQSVNPYPVGYQSIQFNNGTLWTSGTYSAYGSDSLTATVKYVKYWNYLSSSQVQSTSAIIDGAFRNGSAVTIPNFWGCYYY